MSWQRPAPGGGCRASAALLRIGLAWAIGAGAVAGASAQPTSDAQRGVAVVQKLRLVEQLLASSRASEILAGRADGGDAGDADARAALARARELVDRSLQDPAAPQADEQADEARRLVNAALRGRSAAGLDTQLRANAARRQRVEDWRRAIAAELQARRAPPRSPALVALDQNLAEADELSRTRRYADAADALERAERLAVQALAQLRQGQTVTVELRFDTPADEVAYEVERFRSHDLLVDLMLREREMTAAQRQALELRRDGARARRDGARAIAARGEWTAAIRELEAATGDLVRALQAAGVTGLF